MKGRKKNLQKFHSHRNLRLKYMPPQINEEICSGCGTCVENCPAEVLEMQGDKAKVVNTDDCVDCEACVENCPSNAISMS